jgi:6-phosphogluconolactonase (cycloisomerase 2 family)
MKQPTEGDHPCYVIVDNTGKWVIAANYTSGSLSVLPVKRDGSLDKPTTTIHMKDQELIRNGRVNRMSIVPFCHLIIVFICRDLGIDK